VRLDAVTIKTTLVEPLTDEIRRMLRLSGDGWHRRVYFCEARPASGRVGELPLLDNGVILRLRERNGRGADSTVKLRPCRRSRLRPPWLELYGSGHEAFKLDADWCASSRVLAASLTSERGRGDIVEVLAGRRPVRGMFSQNQRRFVAECADVEVDFGRLLVAGPVETTRWGPVTFEGLDLTVERWIVVSPNGTALELLELSLRVEPEGAEIYQVGLDAMLERHGIGAGVLHDTKTRTVLDRLVAVHPAGEDP
jgi:hypothetical protein